MKVVNEIGQEIHSNIEKGDMGVINFHYVDKPYEEIVRFKSDNEFLDEDGNIRRFNND